MLSKNKIKYIKSLQIKKYRKLHQAFLVEGEKIIKELLLSNFNTLAIYGTFEFLSKNQAFLKSNLEVIEVSEKELTQVSSLKTNVSALAIVQIPEKKEVTFQKKDLVLILDNIQDPGNLGTIIRTADWYGLSQIICSKDSVELYNPKVIQATMGSFLRVRIHFEDLTYFFEKHHILFDKIYGAYLEGENLHKTKFSNKNVALVLGNESQGIRPEYRKWITNPLTIPSFGQAESLNVGIATAIFCDNWQRQQI